MNVVVSELPLRKITPIRITYAADGNPPAPRPI